MSRRPHIPPAALALALEKAEREPAPKVTLTLRPALAAYISLYAQAKGVDLELACLSLINQAREDAMRPKKGRAA